MSVEIIVGRNSSGKSRLLYTKALARAKRGKKTIILVPEQYTLEAEKQILSIDENNFGLLEIEVMSITRLMNWVYSSVKKPPFTIIDDIGKTLVIKSILKKNKDEFDVFDGVANLSGFSTSIADLISDLKKFDIVSNDLKNIIKEQEMSSIQLKKINDVVKILDLFNEYSNENGFVDSDDSLNLLVDIIEEKSMELKQFFKNTSIYVDSFDYIPPRNIRLLCSLLPVVDEICVTITKDENNTKEIFSAGIKTEENLLNMVQAHGYDVSYSSTKYVNQNKSLSIKHIEKNLFNYPIKEFKDDCDICVTKAIGINEEVESVSSKILELIASKKYAWNEIVVLCSNLELYTPYVSRVFKQYMVPYFLDERRTVSSHPIVVWLLSALQFADTYSRKQALGMIKTLYAGIDYDDCELFEDYCIACSIQGGMFKKAFRRGSDKYDLEHINQLRKILIAPFKKFNREKKDASLWAKEIYALIESANLKEIITAERIRLEGAGRLDEAAETAQAWNVIVKTLEQLYSVTKNEFLSLDELVSLLEEAFLSAQIGVLPTGLNNILVGDVGRSKTSSIKCMFLLGANDGMLPTPLPEGTIFNESDLAVLKEQGVTAGRDAAFKKAETTYSLYRALISPNEELHISYDSSSSKEPALIVKKILSLFPELIIESATINPFSSPAAAFTLSAKALGAIGDERPVQDGQWKNALVALMNEPNFSEHIDKMYNFAAGGDITQDVVYRKEGDMVGSVSQLEEYARCPYAYMITYGLQPANDPTGKIEYTGSGAFLHKLMEEFGEEINKHDINELSKEKADLIMQAKAKHLAAVFDDGSFAVNEQSEFLKNQLIQTARRGAKVYVKGLKNSDFKPIAHELAFNFGYKYGPIEIDLPDNKKAYLTGKIDRVDEFSNGEEKWLRAIDYKSGKKSVDLSGLMTGESMQLFIYINALKDHSKARAAGVFYYPLRNEFTEAGKDLTDSEKMDGFFVDNSHVINALDTTLDAGEKSEILKLNLNKQKQPYRNNNSLMETSFFDASLKASKETARRLCDGMNRGEMSVNPYVGANKSSCDYCDYSSICRYGAQVHTHTQEPDKQMVTEYIKSFEEGDEDAMD